MSITPENRITVELLLLGLFFVAAMLVASPARRAAHSPVGEKVLTGD